MSFRRGDKTIPATVLNDAVSLARARQNGEFSGRNSRSADWTIRSPGDVVSVYNLISDFARFDFVPLCGPAAQPAMDYGGTPYNWRNVTVPTDDEEHNKNTAFEFNNVNQWTTLGVGNDGRLGWYGCLLDKCKNASWGLAKISGLVSRVVQMQVASHRYAYITTLTGGSQVLKSTLSGPFRIRLRDDNTTGTAYPRNEHCVLEINVPPPKGPWLVRNNTGSAINVGSTGNFSWCGSNNSGNLETVGATVVGNNNVANGERALMYLETEDRSNLGFYVYKS